MAARLLVLVAGCCSYKDLWAMDRRRVPAAGGMSMELDNSSRLETGTRLEHNLGHTVLGSAVVGMAVAHQGTGDLLDMVGSLLGLLDAVGPWDTGDLQLDIVVSLLGTELQQLLAAVQLHIVPAVVLPGTGLSVQKALIHPLQKSSTRS